MHRAVSANNDVIRESFSTHMQISFKLIGIVAGKRAA
jgi:hypothetical protein